MLRRISVLAIFAFAPPVFAANLISNPGFDADVDHWSGPGLTWIAADEADNPASGSAYLEIGGHTSTALQSDCFPLGGGERLVFGASADLTEPAAHTARVAATIRYYSQPGCAGATERTPYPELVAQSIHTGWGPTQATDVAPAAARSARLELVLNADGDDGAAFRVDNAYVFEGASCADTPTALCLESGRFRATARWAVPDGTHGYAGVQPLSADSGYLWFFDSSNLELVLKVLDGCGSNQHFWVFAAGLTNLGVELTVADTLSDATWEFANPVNDPFPPRQDIEAFATCPGS